MDRLALFLAVIVVSLLSTVAQARQSGSWSTTANVVGKYTYNVWDGQTGAQKTGTQDWGTDEVLIAAKNFSAPASAIASYKSQGKIAYRFQWTSTTQAPPNYLWIKATGFATGSGTGANPSANADDALGHSEVASTLRGGLRKTASGVSYRCLAVSGGVAEVTFSVSAYGQASGANSSAGADANVSVELSDRGILAWAYGYEATYGRRYDGLVTAHGGAYQKAVPELNVPDNDDPFSVVQSLDFVLAGARYSYMDNEVPFPTSHLDFGGVASPWVLNNAYFGSDFSDYTWTYNKGQGTLHRSVPGTGGVQGNPFHIDDVGTTYQGYVINVSTGDVSNGDLGIEDRTSLTYTWSDGVSLKYTLAVRSHLPIENVVKYATERDAPSVLSSDYANLSGWVDHNLDSVSYNNPLELAEFQAGQGGAQFLVNVAAAYVGGAAEKLTLAFLDALLGLNQAPTSQVGTRSGFDWAVQRAQEGHTGWIDVIPSGDINSPAVQNMYDWQVAQHRMYQNDWYVGDVWGASGFQGQDDNLLNRWQYSHETRCKYRLYNGYPGDGAGS